VELARQEKPDLILIRIQLLNWAWRTPACGKAGRARAVGVEEDHMKALVTVLGLLSLAFGVAGQSQTVFTNARPRIEWHAPLLVNSQRVVRISNRRHRVTSPVRGQVPTSTPRVGYELPWAETRKDLGLIDMRFQTVSPEVPK
jgi:hypothetical protein